MMWMLRLRKIFKTAGRDVLTLFYAVLEPATPMSVKVLSALMMFYVVSPLDIIPDIFILLGYADDIAVLVFGVPWLLRKVPAQVMVSATARADRLLARFGWTGGGPAR